MKGWEPFLLGEAKALSAWVSDPSVTDLFLNGTRSLFVDRGEGLESHPSPFTESGLRDFLERLVLPLGKRVDAVQPFLDGRVADAARFHAVLPPAVRGAPHLSFRFFRSGARVPLEAFAAPSFIEEGLRDGQNWILCGATGSGKTTLLCRLLERSPSEERIIVVEESR